ncbi:MAG: branched-chain amino acid transport system substrate-binding protein [Clostridiales bacterium]|jgi:branched-chain amino acid transport system substrate-binding protein|nr:branched-chain amino acid transport system substrate-binding protein [Clostridiales bacterium]MDK2932250.1 branched-chain amino acid transport system substrate-binding protein [Clostridiales bacterium]
MKKVFKVFTLVLVVTFLASIVLSGCASKETGSSSESKEKVVKIAFLNPLSGHNADAGQQDLNAAKLAVEHINAAGGIKALDGAKVELIVSDTTSDPTQAQSVAERTLSSHKVAGVVGTGISGLTLPILPVAEKHQVPIITNSISNDITNQGYKYVFEPVPKGSMFGDTQVEFLKALNKDFGLGIKKVAVVYENSAYGVSTAKGVKERAEAAGLEVVINQSYPQGFTDASSLVTAVKQSGAEAVFPVAYTTDAKLIINTMKSMNYDPLIIGGGAGFLWPAMGRELGENINGLVSVASWNWDSKHISEDPELAKIPEAYEEKFGEFMTEHAGPTYSFVWMLKEAMEKTGSSDPKVLRDALAEMEITSGPASLMQPGKVKFESDGWNKYAHPVMIQWQDNKPRTIYPIEDASVKMITPNK